jgi:cytidine deaminase
VVYTEANVLTTPCGACRQVMQELAPDARVHLASDAGVQRVVSVPELFPHAFGAASLKT